MKTECPHCGQHYEVDQEYIDQIVECTSCRQEFVVEIFQEQDNTSTLQNYQQASVQEHNVVNPAPQEIMGYNSVTIESHTTDGGLRALTCEMCGSTDMIKQNGVFVCQSCGTKYSLEEAKKMMITGTVNVAGTVKVDMSEKLKNLYTIARRAKDEDNSENAAKYYDLILQEDPESWEASFYLIYYKAMACKIAEISSAASSVESCLKSVIGLIIKQVSDKEKRNDIFLEITDKATGIATMLGGAAINHFEEIDAQVKNQFAQDYIYNILSSAQICYTWGDLLETTNEAKKLSCVSWKIAIDLHKMCIAYCADKRANESILEKYAAKIRKIEPNYTLPAIPSQGCYIATAVYGSYDCPEVWTLRRFRDFTLGATWYGRTFIKLYYAISPTIVKYFGQTKIFQTFWRRKLDRFVKELNNNGVSSKPYVDKNW